jgi:hypothetical protein
MMNLGDMYLSIPYIARVMQKDASDCNQMGRKAWLAEAEEIGG